MTLRIKTATAVALLVTATPQYASAQMIPGCGPAAEPRDLANIEPGPVRGLGMVEADRLAALAAEGRLCVGLNGRLNLRDGDGAAAAADPAGATGETPPASEPAPTAPPAGEVAGDGADPLQPETPAQTAPAADVADDGAERLRAQEEALRAQEEALRAQEEALRAQEAEERRAEEERRLQQALEAERRAADAAAADTPAADTTAGDGRTVEATADVEGRLIPGCGPAAEAMALADVEPGPVRGLGDADANTIAALAAEGRLCVGLNGRLNLRGETAGTDPDAAAEGRPVDVAAGDDGDAAVAETTETTITEDTARSSDEDFADADRRDGGRDRDRGGLSNFEKFALGAAGLVVLDQLIGNNAEVVRNTGDRVVVRRDDGDLYVLKDDDVLLRRPGSEVRTETFQDGSTRTVVTRPDGVQVVTIAAPDGRVLRRTRIFPDGHQVVLFDDTQGAEPVDVVELRRYQPEIERYEYSNDRDALLAALEAERYANLDRRFTLAQVRNILEVRELMPEIVLDAINFETGSAAIRPEEARDLIALGEAMAQMIEEDPGELFLIEGHTDAVGDPAYNLALSDRRAESVALALTEYFNVPPENMIVQGYGEEHLLIPTAEAERANRRATVRRITPLLTASAN